MRNTPWILGLVLVIAGAACNRVVIEPDRGQLERGAMKADGSNSCKNSCGAQAAAGCWCDEACVQHGDCCQDKGQHCDGQPGSCKGHCGGQSPGGCFCDDQCAQLGDCCGDKAQQCGVGPDCPACATVCDPTFVGDIPAGCPGMLECGCGGSCGSASDCGTCLGISGCNWTGGTCADSCLQDTDCYGPGNPAAPACPAGPPACNVLDGWECLARSDCEPMWGVCLAYCTPENADPDCCEFLGCKPKGCPPVVCTLYCEHGFKTGPDGCQVCECADPPAGCDGLGMADCQANSACEWIEPTPQPGSPPPMAYCTKKGTKPPPCAPQDAAGDGPCFAIIGYAWNGQACLELGGCSCKGADCGAIFSTIAACEAAYASCVDCWGAWIDPTATHDCRGPNDGTLPDHCCDTERQAQCTKANLDYVAALDAAKSCSPMVTAPQCTQWVNEDLMCPVCGTFVNDKSGLKQSEDRWTTLRCSAVGGAKGWWGCPPVVCDPPLSGLCDVSTSKCQDVFQ